MLRDKWFVTKLAVLVAALALVISAIVVILEVLPILVAEQDVLLEPTNQVETAAVRSVVVSDEEVVPLLPIKGARLHFMHGNRIELGHESVSFGVTVSCGASGGLLWFSGIPTWLDLSRVDSNIDSYCSRWTPAWRFIVDSSAAATNSVVPEDGIRTGSTTPRFDWMAIAGEPGAKYYLQVSLSPDFQQLLVDEKVYDAYYQVTDDQMLASGEYYWRLQQRGKIWIIGMPPWLDLSKYDPEVTEMPTVISVETGDGTAQINYVIE